MGDTNWSAGATVVAGARPWPAGDRMASAECRPRWRDFLALAFAFAWETDQSGNFVFAVPQEVLGWRATALLGRAGADLLAAAPGGFDPFAIGPAFRDRRVWLRGADGSVTCLSMAGAPIVQGGIQVGMRGVAQPMEVRDAEQTKVSAALWRGEVVDYILRQMRQEVLAPRMMQAVLEALTDALGAAGTVVVDLLAKPGTDAVLHRAGMDPAAVVGGLSDALQADTADPVIGAVAGHPTLTCPSYTRFGDRAGLCVWREAGGQPWTDDDALLASAATTLVRVVLEHEAIQRELARQARTDPLTGLLNRQSFLEEIDRRINRLACEGTPGTLMYIDLDHLKRLNDQCGQEVGDTALTTLATLLRAAVRPWDVVARLGGDKFAVWLDGSDELTAAERAEQFRLDAPALLAAELPEGAPAQSTSIGIAARHSHLTETLEQVMLRADQAMSEAKRLGRAQWRVAPAPYGF